MTIKVPPSSNILGVCFQMFLVFEDCSRNVFTNGNTIGKAMQYPAGAIQGDNIHWDI